MTDIQRDYEQRYPGLNSRWLAYCYAVDRHPTDSIGPRVAEIPVVWIGGRVDRAVAELGITRERLRPDEHQAVTDKLWQYAVEERG